LGDTFFNAGYNVYIPRVPSHGLTDNKRFICIKE
jgi:esterase/lipase